MTGGDWLFTLAIFGIGAVFGFVVAALLATWEDDDERSMRKFQNARDVLQKRDGRW